MNSTFKDYFFPLNRFAGFTEVDGSVLFYNIINSRIASGSVVLDFGAGRGLAVETPSAWRRTLTSTRLLPVKRIAVDVDPIVLTNPFATEHHVMPINDHGIRIPLDDASVDVVICDWVVEHLPDPVQVFSEFRRVLRVGGMVAIRTSNQWHYAYLAARMLGETQLATRILNRAQPQRKEEDVFPKIYRANTRRSLGNALCRAGFVEPTVFTWDAEPAYVGTGVIGNVLGFALHRLALAGLLPRSSLFGFASKSS